MAGDSLKSMYKVKLREENTISTRRMSRGLERKKHREDEVNKRRLLSDHMSPVLEDESFQRQDQLPKPVTQEKVFTRLQRLKQWREERKRTTEQQRKGGQKPVFKVSPLKHIGESHLYQSTAAHQVKPGRQVEKIQEQVSATLITSSRQQVKAQTGSHKSARGSRVPAEKSAKYQSGKTTSSKDRQPAGVQSCLDRQAQHRPMIASVSQSATRSQATGKLQGTGSRVNLAGKLTVSAAAKAQANVDKPRAFLRANSRVTRGTNSRVTRGTAQSQALDDKKSTNSQRQDMMGPCKQVENHMDVVCSGQPDYSQSSSSSDSKEMHLSDSAVSTPKHSTPAPRRSVCWNTASASRGTQNVDDCKNSSNSSMDVLEERLDQQLGSGAALMEPASLQQVLTLSQSHSVVHGQRTSLSVEINHKKGSKGLMDNGSQSPSIELVHTSMEYSEVFSVLEVSDKENVTRPQTELSPVSDGTPSGRQSNLPDQQTVVCLPVSGRQKSQRRSQRLASIASVGMNSASGKRPQSSETRTRPHDASSRLALTDDSNTQPPDAGSRSKPANSAVAKRRSVRIAGVAFSSPPDSQSDDELVTTQYRKTPAAKRRPSTATHFTQEHGARSTFVSVSQEGTSHFRGENIGDNTSTWTTPRHKPVRRRTATPTFDISQQATTLSGDDSSTVYEVRKPVEAQASLRALQELAVKKYEGETSFIEVPLDDSTDDNVSASTMALPEPSLTTADVMVVDVSSTTTITDEDNQSTQPFTPRSNEMSTSVDSCIQISATPRSSRSRGLSVSGFKTPAQPVSHSRSKPRQTPLKSPEEMIEILKKSPMIEFTRRRSRHLHLSGGNQLSTSMHSLDVSMSTSEELTPCPLPSLGSPAVAAAKDGPQITKMTQLDVTSGVQHFRQLLEAEGARLQQLCDTWTGVSSSSPSLTEDVSGQIRSTIGKAQLLMDQRFQQFSGLVDNCQYGHGEKETTLTDLQGFWEMIDLQVEDVKQLFANLTQLQQNHWQVKQPSPARNLPKRKVVKMSKPKIKSNFAAFREEIIRRKAQAAVKPTMLAADHTLETTKVFDAGFFNVTSPVRKSGRKSEQQTILMPAEDSSSSSEEKQGQHAGMSADQSYSPVSAGNKENQLSTTPGSRLLPLSAKRLSYLPAVPSPLLNDITGLLSKKF